MLRFKTGFSALISATELTKDAENHERCEEKAGFGIGSVYQMEPFFFTLLVILIYNIELVSTSDLFNLCIPLVKLVKKFIYNAAVKT